MQVQQAAKEEGLQAGTCRVDCIHTICTSVLSFCIASIASLHYVIIPIAIFLYMPVTIPARSLYDTYSI